MRSSTMMKRLLAMALVISILASWAVPVSALDSGISYHKVDNSSVSADPFNRDTADVPEKEPEYAEMDTVRVSIFLDKAGTLDAGFPANGIAKNSAAIAYRNGLEQDQDALVEQIEAATDESLDVVANLTLAANLISANVKYGQIKTIEKIKGVRNVVIETAYAPAVASKAAADPNMATSGIQIGSSSAYASGYTGAGSRIAVIDTGVDIDHLSFDSSAFEYSLSKLAEKSGMTAQDYVASLNLLDAEEVTAVWDQLHISALEGLTAEHLYFGSKIPFGFNYVDVNNNITHLYDKQGEHGSHVAGIAGANAYVPTGEDTFANALEAVHAQGVAPDAQLIVMKVFGENGGAYPADYMLAIEDAIVLGADVINMSLGSANPGMSSDTTAEYQAIFDSLEKSGVVVAISAGNAGSWVESAESGIPYLYLDDVSMHTSGTPGTYTNSLGVASVDNAGFTGLFINVGGQNFYYYDSNSGTYTNQPITTIAGEQEFVLIDGIGSPEDWAAVGDALVGKVAICSRGDISFFEKAVAAVDAGAIATIIYNNTTEGMFGMDLTDYPYTEPCISMSLQDAMAIMAMADPVMEGETVLYYTGTMNIGASTSTGYYSNPYYSMSSFSSWGVPGSLELKPEITAPGGSIHSVGGAYYDSYTGDVVFGDHASYEVMSGTSMAAPQVAGMAALVAQYIREEGLEEKTGLDARTLAQSLLMSTAVPVVDGENGGYYYPVIQQGAGLANVGAAVMADSYILMGEDATASYADGKVKVELGDDPSKAGVYTFSFTINNLTDGEKTYALSADFFTQGAFAANIGYGASLFMDTWTTPLAPAVTWTVNGKAVEGGAEMAGMDFNGDGYVNSHDGQALLDYAVGNLEEISNADKANLNADETVNSYDAYLFFEMLGLNGAVVPANGSAEVTVTVTLTEDDKAWLANYENGAYLEGFVYAESLTTDEGVEGTSHSIPVLGFYGNWSDASMFDKVSYTDYAHGTFTQIPYVASSGVLNGLIVEGYYLGGNPYIPDSVYMPERNAISGMNNDVIDSIVFTSIRNAGESLFYIAGAGQYLLAEPMGPVSSAFYYTNGGYWENTYYELGIGIDAQTLYSILGDTTYEVGLTLAPEYYVDAEGNVDWAALGDGTTFSVPFTIDIAAPELKDVSISMMNNTLNLTVSDNKYVAAVALFDQFGEHVYTVAGSVEDAAAGDTVDYALDLTGVNGASFLVQIFDYAGNVTTYAIEQQIGEVVDTVAGVEVNPASLMLQKGSMEVLSATVSPVNASDRTYSWSSSDETVATVDANGVVTAVGVGTALITATSTLDPTKTASCEVEVIDINVDLNGIVWDENGSIWFSQFNTADLPNYEKLSGDMLDTDYMVAACTAPDGTLYASSLNTSTGTGSLYTVDPETYEVTKLNDCVVQGMSIFYSDLTYVPAMFGTGVLLGTYGPYVIAIDPVSGESYGIIDQYDSDLVGITTCYGMYDPEYGEYQDVVYVIENDGTVTQEIYYGYDFMVVPYFYYFYGERASFETGIDKGSAWYFNSAYYDGTYLYWSAFDQENENNVTLYAIDADYSGNVYNLGQFADGVWPVGGLHQSAAVSGAEATGVNPEEIAAWIKEHGGIQQKEYVLEKISVEEKLSAGEFEIPAHPMSGSTIGEKEKTVTVQITAGELAESAAAHTNGVSVVTYDSGALTLQSLAVNGDYTAAKQEDGKVTFGYVDLEGMAANAVVATLVFEVKSTEDQEVTVEHKEVNDTTPGTSETVNVTYPHTNTEIRGEKKETCTEDGYTGDIYCVDCDKLLSKGEVIPATGHTMGEWTETKAPTCTEKGKQTKYCADCDYTETRDVDATGHTMGEWKETKAPTCAEKGEQTKYCADCDYTETREVEMIEHTMSKWKPVASESGKHYRECACGETETTDCTFDIVAITKMPTVDAEGEKTYTCSVCGATKQEKMDKLEPTEELESENAKLNVGDESDAAVDKDSTLVVEYLDAGQKKALKEKAKEDLSKAGGEGSQMVYAYDVSLLLDGIEVQPGGEVSVTVASPVNTDLYASITVVAVDEYGNVTACETMVNADGTITFVTDELCSFAVMAVSADYEPPYTGDASVISMWSVLANLSGLATVVLVKKRKLF